MPERIPTDDLLDDLHRVADELGRPPTSTAYRSHGSYAVGTITSRFGGWAEALAEAGLRPLPDDEDTPIDGDPDVIQVECHRCNRIQACPADDEQFICVDCTATVPLWRGRVTLLDDNPIIRRLAQGPATKAELDRDLTRAERAIVVTLSAPTRSKPNKARGRPSQVYYLYGDDRAAMRHFIDVNTAYVESCIDDQNNPLRRNWPDEQYRLLVEQWAWTGRDASDSSTDQ